MAERERRYVTNEFTVRADGSRTVIEGHAAVFNRYSQNLGGFVEQVAPGAFAKTIAEADVRALFNHDASMVLGRNKAGTLRLAEDNVGLAYEIDVPGTQLGRDLAVSMERGDISQSSFSFRVVGPDGDDWSLTDQGMPLRTLREVALYDVGPVTFPAYLDADSGVGKRALARFATPERPLDDVLALAAAGELRSLIDGSAVVPGPVPATRSLIDAARRRLQLLELDAA